MSQQLYSGGTILTMEKELYAEALLAENGVIKAVGTEKELSVMAEKDCERIDLKGHTLMPAFMDPHSHFSGCAFSTLQVPMGGCRSYAEIKQRISDFIRKNHIPAGHWVTAQGYDHNDLEEKTPPRREVLDEAAPENPVILSHQSGHTGVLNTMALEKMGITPETPVPEGGMMEIRDGNVTGYLEETAFMAVQGRMPQPDPEEMISAFEQAQEVYASHGITTAQEGMLMPQMVPLYKALCAHKKLKLDIVGYLDIENADTLRAQLKDYLDGYRDHFRVGGYKTFLDGSPQARTAWLRQPYEGAEDDYCGYPRTTDEALKKSISRAMDENMQLLVHCNGDAACEQYLRVYEECKEERTHAGLAVPEIRPVMIHAQLLGEDQIPAMKKIGMMPSFFVSHVYHWGDIHIKNFGRKRAEKISPASSAQKAGIPFTFHQDTPVLPPDMLETVWCAVNRLTKSGEVLGKDERIPVLDALRAVTVSAAYQYSEENTKGSLRAGKNADLVILEENPLEVPAMHLRDIRVLETIRNGEVIYSNPEQ